MKSRRFPPVRRLAVLAAVLTCPLVRAQAPKPEAKEPARIWDHQGSVLSITFTRDGRQVLTAGAAESEGVVLWDAKTGKRLRALAGTELVYSAALSPDGKKVATAGA